MHARTGMCALCTHTRAKPSAWAGCAGLRGLGDPSLGLSRQTGPLAPSGSSPAKLPGATSSSGETEAQGRCVIHAEADSHLGTGRRAHAATASDCLVHSGGSGRPHCTHACTPVCPWRARGCVRQFSPSRCSVGAHTRGSAGGRPRLPCSSLPAGMWVCSSVCACSRAHVFLCMRVHVCAWSHAGCWGPPGCHGVLGDPSPFCDGTAPAMGTHWGGCRGSGDMEGLRPGSGMRGELGGGRSWAPRQGSPKTTHHLQHGRAAADPRALALRPPPARGWGGRGEQRGLARAVPVPRQLLLLRWHPLPCHPRTLHSGGWGCARGEPTSALCCGCMCLTLWTWARARRCWCSKPRAILRQDRGVLRVVLGARISPICSQELGVPWPASGCRVGSHLQAAGDTHTWTGPHGTAWHGVAAERSWGAAGHTRGLRRHTRVVPGGQDRCRACSVAALCCHRHGSAQHPPAPHAAGTHGRRARGGGGRRPPRGMQGRTGCLGTGMATQDGDNLKEPRPGHQRG